MTPRSLRIALAALLGVALVGYFSYFFDRKRADDLSVPGASTSIPAPTSPPLPIRPEGQAARDFREPGLPALAVVPPLPLTKPENRSPLADSLNAPEQTGMQDLATVMNLFDHYHEQFRGLPTGENNAQIVNALTGNNPRRLALIERSHPAINPDGELTDRWGSPLFFHLISHEAIEVRSAGPDKEMWNEDDLLTQSTSLRQPSPQAP